MTYSLSASAPAAPARPAPAAGLSESALAEHLGLVHHVARQLKRGLAADADLEELVSAGTLGLMEAARGFDPSRGLAFSTFAAPRIRGAILDELRRHDPLPRSVRRRSRDTSSAREALTRELGRAPSDRELAAHMGVDLETFSRWRADAEGGVRISIDRPVRDGDERSPAPMDVLHDEDAPTVEDRINRQEEAALLRDAILGLKDQERVVLSLYYFEEMKLHEIATVLEVTESRVSQIRTKALARLRVELAVLRAA
ncbi:FliA/WhiG family RNA polymerase sigma factor [Longimicrobium sp.]|uniref:sigma-70 family RNA polymerase sigma factor n=1 Tax=Longimicrobium sp. TaxID=2029185 RepID=UPI002E3261CF|nr:FliA/WhiG family RNA polymerase sigma factor [Longimicrobium sp.]HEX6038392.1 FliA/WhiG family RNA polymerase sigma factor [Longimicrobium sp.]